MNKFISIASLFLIYAILIVSSNGETTLLLQENLKKRATSTSEQSTYVQRMISKKNFDVRNNIYSKSNKLENISYISFWLNKKNTCNSFSYSPLNAGNM